MKTGSADLPLHGGHCPPQLFEKMKSLGGAITEAILLEFSRDEYLRRLSEPGWFQSLGCVLGFDWHSSGLTTVVCGALKEVLNPRAHELGIYVAGGKGASSRKTPEELAEYSDKYVPNLAVANLQRASKLAAKVDNNAVQDKHQLYHHCFFVTRDGNWTVIQQGMNKKDQQARRYHWLSDAVDSFVNEPHSGVCAENQLRPLNLVHDKSRENRQLTVDLAREKPGRLLKDYQTLLDYWDEEKKRLNLPDRHDVPRARHLEKVLNRLYEKQHENFEDLLGEKNVGPKSIRALSMVAEVIWGAETSYSDPARYSFAHGGKDGHPYPVNGDRYERTLRVLRRALRKAKVKDSDRNKALRRLDKLQE